MSGHVNFKEAALDLSSLAYSFKTDMSIIGFRGTWVGALSGEGSDVWGGSWARTEVTGVLHADAENISTTEGSADVAIGVFSTEGASTLYLSGTTISGVTI